MYSHALQVSDTLTNTKHTRKPS